MSSVMSLQIGRIAPLGPNHVPSAFVKHAVTGSVRADVLGLAGDEQADLSVHGGLEKAVYFYPSEHYPSWAADVPRHETLLLPGAFGENITTIGLDESTVSIGDVFAIGSTEMQITQPRQPCFKLSLRFADNTLGKIMMQTSRTGWYVRVLQAGDIQAGDEIRVIRRPNPQWTIARFNDFIRHRSAAIEEMKEIVDLDGLASGWREGIREALNARGESGT